MTALGGCTQYSVFGLLHLIVRQGLIGGDLEAVSPPFLFFKLEINPDLRGRLWH